MRSYHWGMILLFLLVGYALGLWMPGPGIKVRSIIGI